MLSDHSTSARLITLISGIYDFFTKSFFSIQAGLFRYTRIESILDLLQNIPLNNIKLYIQNLYINSELFTYNNRPFPVYSFFGYLLSETGLISIIFVSSIFLIIKKGLQYASTDFKRINSEYVLRSVIGLIPLSYFIYILIGYPRALPYFVVANILFLKKINHKSQLI